MPNAKCPFSLVTDSLVIIATKLNHSETFQIHLDMEMETILLLVTGALVIITIPNVRLTYQVSLSLTDWSLYFGTGIHQCNALQDMIM